MNWTQQEAIELCRRIELRCPLYGCHVALTGGLLYKEGERKDCDLVFYRIRQEPKIDTECLVAALEDVGLSFVSGFGFVLKFVTDDGKMVDAMFPEEVDGPEYNPDNARNAELELEPEQFPARVDQP